jgi:uncharacterized RDD family membrane protein YckC
VWEKPISPTGQPFRFVQNLKVDRRAGYEMGFYKSLDHDRLYFVHDYGLRTRSFEYRDGELEEVELPWESNLDRIMRWLVPTIGQAIAILIVGLLLLIGSAEWIARTQHSRYEFGLQSRILAPIGLRCLARAIDLVLILMLSIVSVWRIGIIGLAELANDLWLHIPLAETGLRAPLNQAISWAAVTFVILVVTQAIWGVTPGKWLCGLRVMRSTLRPCGFARSLLRELTFVLDAPLLLTILPGIASMLLSDQRERIGDRFADTVVVRKN